uniref:SMP-30/Gluconolactonase/LRE-like region domain-containing protein n=1 Tax=Branchiostoma floridae TaxID=7739 RepID=C3ZUJ1_BRAFL|eukprot:XP_002587819.1 hypothetical protein BRAFLDRAFT_92270 [Branchiostoma floridae]
MKPKKITFGEEGRTPIGVAISADNEIYVSDSLNNRVQVFNKYGVFLRLFKTVYVVPGKRKQTISPNDVAIDAKGSVWVVGHIRDWVLGVVQYSQSGQQISTIDLTTSHPDPTIAVNARNNNIVVVARKIFVFLSDGSLYNKFRLVRGVDSRYAAYNNDGNSLLITAFKHGTVQVYTQDGDKLFQFGSNGRGKGQLRGPTGICTDSSGNIFVSNMKNNRIDMFTSRGEFVRTVVSTNSPWKIACGPDGQLVVANSRHSTVTIIPRQLVSS